MRHHSERVFSTPDFLTPNECQNLIALAEARGFEPAEVRTDSGQKMMANVRNNQRVMVESPEWVDLLWTRLVNENLPRVDEAMAAGFPKDLRFYKYIPGQRFKMHKDGPWSENGLTSKLTFLVYLNDAFTGGATDFRTFKIEPEAGMALLFVHDTWHEGEVVTSGVKFVLRSDVLYRTS